MVIANGKGPTFLERGFDCLFIVVPVLFADYYVGYQPKCDPEPEVLSIQEVWASVVIQCGNAIPDNGRQSWEHAVEWQRPT